MIQRVQTVYLAAASTLFAVAAILAFGGTDALNTNDYVGISIAGLLSVGLAISVFLHGDRKKQARLVRSLRLAALLLTVLFGLLLVVEGPLDTLFAFLPLALSLGGTLTVHLGARAIKRDIDLVKSMDRIR